MLSLLENEMEESKEMQREKEKEWGGEGRRIEVETFDVWDRLTHSEYTCTRGHKHCTRGDSRTRDCAIRAFSPQIPPKIKEGGRHAAQKNPMPRILR